LDPKLKRWKRELICDNCHRWAAALTLLKSGDVWDQQDWTRHLVGKRLCNNCIPRYVGLILRGYNPKSQSQPFFKSWMFIVAGLFFASIAAFGVAWSLNASPAIPSILFLACLVVFYGGIAGKWIIAKFRDGTKKPSTTLNVEPAPLISMSLLFNGSNDMN